MAFNDLNQWASAVGAVLPGYLATINCSQANFPVTCTIQLQWTENGVAVNAQQTQIGSLVHAELRPVRAAMSTLDRLQRRKPVRAARGFTFVEIMVAIALGLFLIGGLLTLVQAMRRTATNQSGMSQLQDNERMAMQLITDVVQSTGYYTNPLTNSAPAAFLVGTYGPASFTSAQALMGNYTAGVPDIITNRYQTAGTTVGDNAINCTGNANATPASFVNQITVNTATNYLTCTVWVNANPSITVSLVPGITGMSDSVRRGERRRRSQQFRGCLPDGRPGHRRQLLAASEIRAGDADVRKPDGGTAGPAGDRQLRPQYRGDVQDRGVDMITLRQRARARGMILVTALLMLVVVTILALAMFRSFGLDEKIAGNLREKQRALSAAETAEQYAEYWLTGGGGSANAPLINCTTPAPASAPTICTNPIASATQLPWLAGGNLVGVPYTPQVPSRHERANDSAARQLLLGAAILCPVAGHDGQRHDLSNRCAGLRRQPGHGGRSGIDLHRADRRQESGPSHSMSQ